MKLLDIDNPRWMENALCRTQGMPDDWFSTDPRGGYFGKLVTDRVALICKRCPVRQQCLEYALENNEKWGIWGGYSAGQRRGMART